MNIADLERKIDGEQYILNEYERQLGNEKDPREKQRLQEEIEKAKIYILGLQTELARQRAADSPPLPRSSAPLPSKLIANAPYGLETALVGRADERLLLDDWFHRDPDHPFLAVIGLGGQGKSALIWDWLQGKMQARETPPLVVWWSFYEIDGSVDKLMDKMLAHFEEDPAGLSSLRAKTERVLQHLQRGPALLLLDGAERLLRAYHGLGAAYQGDETDGAGGLREHARQCVDPVAGQLLQWLAAPGQMQAKTLLTSRLFPEELGGRSGLGLAGVRRHDLTGLSPEAAYQLFRELGIACTRAEVAAVAAPLGYHPLSLRLLARRVAFDPATPNDLRAAARYDPGADLLGKRQHVLAAAYDSLPRTAQQLLSRLAAFRGSVDWEVIAAVFGQGDHAVRAHDDAPLQEDLRILQQRGLLERSIRIMDNGSRTTVYDLHPIVRRYAYDRLANRTETHAQLVVYFEAVPRPERVRSVADLLPAMELYHHLARAGKYDEAFALFRDRLARPLYFQLGAYQTRIELLRALFPDGEGQPPRLREESDQAWTLNELANSYGQTGQPVAAVHVFQQAADMAGKQGNKKNLAIGLGNLATQQMAIGALAAAADNLRRAIALDQELESKFDEASDRQEYGRLLTYTAQWDEAAAELDTALEQFTAEHAIQSQGIVWAYRALAALLRGEGETAVPAAQEAYKIATNRQNERDRIRAEWLLGWAALATGDLDTAQRHLDEALRRCRAINLVQEEPAILLAQARLARARVGAGNVRAGFKPAPTGESWKWAEEARQIAARAGYILDLADIHNHLALLALDAGDMAAARQHAQQAYDYAYCDGLPYAYQPALDEAERILQQISP